MKWKRWKFWFFYSWQKIITLSTTTFVLPNNGSLGQGKWLRQNLFWSSKYLYHNGCPFFSSSAGEICILTWFEIVEIRTKKRRPPTPSLFIVDYVNSKLYLLYIPLVRVSWLWLYGSWIYYYLYNQCLSPPRWVRILLMVWCSTRYKIM